MKKYEKAMKEKMLISFSKEKLFNQIKSLEFKKEEKSIDLSVLKKTKTKLNDTLPKFERENPFLDKENKEVNYKTLKLKTKLEGHLSNVCGISIHPEKPIIASVSEDKTWKIWSILTEKQIMSGEGHKSWISSIDFHPLGYSSATSSGDNSVNDYKFIKNLIFKIL
jgi:sperm-associated antigen 16 protein